MEAEDMIQANIYKIAAMFRVSAEADNKRNDIYNLIKLIEQ